MNSLYSTTETYADTLYNTLHESYKDTLYNTLNKNIYVHFYNTRTEFLNFDKYLASYSQQIPSSDWFSRFHSTLIEIRITYFI
jgi:hypothetical protein